MYAGRHGTKRIPEKGRILLEGFSGLVYEEAEALYQARRHQLQKKKRKT
jgi:hypothetical protein